MAGSRLRSRARGRRWFALGVAATAAACAGGVFGAAGGADAGPGVTPPGHKAPVAFVRVVAGGGDIYVLAADATRPRQITSGRGDDQWPAWSPDRRRLAFARTLGRRSAIYVVSSAGGRARRVTPFTERATTPAWSPDGRALVYAAGSDGRSALFLVRAAGGRPVPFAHAPRVLDTTPAWSPDGGSIAWARFNGRATDIWVARPDGTHARQLTAIGDATSPAWSPDGHELAFANGGVIDLISARGRGLRQLVAGGGWAGRPTWSPDGLAIAFWTSPGRGTYVVSMPSIGGARTRLTDGGSDLSPAWAPAPGTPFAIAD